jgi:protein involved in temperature-dependent protein secretion
MSERKKGASTKHKPQNFDSQAAAEGGARSNAFDNIRDMASGLTPVAEVGSPAI